MPCSCSVTGGGEGGLGDMLHSFLLDQSPNTSELDEKCYGVKDLKKDVITS